MDGARLTPAAVLEENGAVLQLLSGGKTFATPRPIIRREADMFIPELSRNTQRVTCMLAAALIVISVLSLGAYGVDSLAHPGYSVTITELP